jgi:prepilin-type N-terminal cleavage/methylation domain-containing protein
MEQQMTSSLHRKSSGGFTLIELLVVIGIIVLLATVLLPMINKAYSQANRAAMAADLQVICQALDAYKHDFGDYPRIDQSQGLQAPTGAALLCWALIAPGPASSADPKNPGDGADGPGFRVRGNTGAVSGPYLPPDRFRIGVVDIATHLVVPPGIENHSAASFNNLQDVLADRNNSPILYFAATRSASATSAPNGFVGSAFAATGPVSLFYFGDNVVYLTPPYGNPANLTRAATGWQVMSYRLGDSVHTDGTIDPTTENAITTGPFLLWSAGPDTIFGNDDDVMTDGTQLQQVTGSLPTGIAPP